MSGLGKYFNSETFTGRANVAKATYASFALIYLYFRLKRSGVSKTPQPIEEQFVETEPIPEPLQPCPCTPCPPISPPVVPAPPANDEPKDDLKEDPLFKQKIPALPRRNGNYDCDDDDDYDDKSKSKYDDDC